jgi:hypothetical protein
VLDVNSVGLIEEEASELPICESDAEEDERLVMVLEAPPVESIEDDAEVESLELLEIDPTGPNEDEIEATELKACTVDRDEDPKLELLERDWVDTKDELAAPGPNSYRLKR